jgi:hypothetical protein
LNCNVLGATTGSAHIRSRKALSCCILPREWTGSSLTSLTHRCFSGVTQKCRRKIALPSRIRFQRIFSCICLSCTIQPFERRVQRQVARLFLRSSSEMFTLNIVDRSCMIEACKSDYICDLLYVFTFMESHLNLNFPL